MKTSVLFRSTEISLTELWVLKWVKVEFYKVTKAPIQVRFKRILAHASQKTIEMGASKHLKIDLKPLNDPSASHCNGRGFKLMHLHEI